MPIPSETTGWNSGGANRLEPTSGKKATGWLVDEKPASSYFNWLFATIEAWLVYLATFLSTANIWTALQTFSAGLEADGGVSVPAILARTTGFSGAKAIQVQSIGGDDAISVAVSAGSGAGLAIDVNGSGFGASIAASANAALKVLGNATHGALWLTGLTGDPSAPNEGEVYYNNSAHVLKVYNGTAWKTVTMT